MIFIIAKGIIAALLLIQGLRALFEYNQANTNWHQSKGTIVDWEYSSSYKNVTSYPIVRFQTSEGKNVITKTDFHLPLTHLLYRKGTEVDILYLPDNPEKAMVKTILAPITYGLLVVLGFYIFGAIRF